MKSAFFYIVLGSLALSSCSSNQKSQTAVSGVRQILVDESFAPIIDDQYRVFESTYTQAKIELVYKPEIDLLNLFLQDSINVAIMSRKLLPNEARFFESKKIRIRTNRIATDAIALIGNYSSTDTTITVEEIKAIMQGKASNRRLVFDNPNSSTVRYLKELAGINNLPKQGVYSLNSNEEVIKYVNNNSGTIGVIGINWIMQPTKELESIVGKLKILAVKNEPGLAGSDSFYEPTQSNLALGLYPLSRELYIINCEGGPGLGTGFASFLAGERGQRIILKSGLLPDSIPTREIIIR